MARGNAGTSLRLDWCGWDAAVYACTHWHYSGTVPQPPLIRIGVWEDAAYIGCVLFGRGANNNLLRPYGLAATEGAELVRVALRSHVSPVSRIVAIAMRLVRASNPGLRLFVSHADPNQGHAGGIYQAGGWIYAGTTAPYTAYIDATGRRWHSRMISSSGVAKVYGQRRAVLRPDQCDAVPLAGKHRYLMPLDDEMRQRIAPLARSYPKKPTCATSIGSDAAPDRGAQGGATPTVALQYPGSEQTP